MEIQQELALLNKASSVIFQSTLGKKLFA